MTSSLRLPVFQYAINKILPVESAIFLTNISSIALKLIAENNFSPVFSFV